MSARRPLDVIEVRNPCPADWDAMAGDGSRRFCSYCQKYVHDLSSMPTAEAERLVCESARSLCIRFARDEGTGKVITLDYASVPKTSRRRALITIASILGSLGFAGAWAAAKLMKQPQSPPMVLGDLVYPTPPSPPKP